MEHARAFEPVQDGRIYIEVINHPFLYVGGAQGGARLCDCARLARTARKRDLCPVHAIRQRPVRIIRGVGTMGLLDLLSSFFNPTPPGKHANAVRVEIDGRRVGYLPRELAFEYRAALGETAGQCSAKIVGGYERDDGSTDHFGVKLHMAWPPRLKRSQ
jgi:hypothetical protein